MANPRLRPGRLADHGFGAFKRMVFRARQEKSACSAEGMPPCRIEPDGVFRA